VATGIESETTLTDQTRAEGLEYRVIIISKVRQGQPTNTVMVVQ
jgi:hypothetical protein